MKNFIIFLAVILGLSLCANAQNLITGGVNYNVNSARQELLQNKPNKLNPQLVSMHISDEHHKQNLNNILKGQLELQDRTLANFSDGTYGVIYKDDLLHVWYYDASGTLTYIEEKDSLIYPYKSYKYNLSGKLVNMGLRVSKGETFIYNPEGKLIAHWVNSNGYDENGNIIMTRKYSE